MPGGRGKSFARQRTQDCIRTAAFAISVRTAAFASQHAQGISKKTALADGFGPNFAAFIVSEVAPGAARAATDTNRPATIPHISEKNAFKTTVHEINSHLRTVRRSPARRSTARRRMHRHHAPHVRRIAHRRPHHRMGRQQPQQPLRHRPARSTRRGSRQGSSISPPTGATSTSTPRSRSAASPTCSSWHGSWDRAARSTR